MLLCLYEELLSIAWPRNTDKIFFKRKKKLFPVEEWIQFMSYARKEIQILWVWSAFNTSVSSAILYSPPHTHTLMGKILSNSGSLLYAVQPDILLSVHSIAKKVKSIKISHNWTPSSIDGSKTKKKCLLFLSRYLVLHFMHLGHYGFDSHFHQILKLLYFFHRMGLCSLTYLVSCGNSLSNQQFEYICVQFSHHENWQGIQVVRSYVVLLQEERMLSPGGWLKYNAKAWFILSVLLETRNWLVDNPGILVCLPSSFHCSFNRCPTKDLDVIPVCFLAPDAGHSLITNFLVIGWQKCGVQETC